MSVTSPEFNIPRRSVFEDPPDNTKAGLWVKFPPMTPTESPETPELLAPTNPVPEVMLAAGFQNIVSVPHTVQRDLLNNLIITTWDGLKNLAFFTFADANNPVLSGNYPAATIRVPRGVVFHSDTRGKGPPPHTIHWHGIEPTPINDGVGHCSMEIGGYLYQWQPNFIGHYFYHCHRNTVQHFEFGLFGLLLIEPPDAYFASIANPNPDGSAPDTVILNDIPIGACRDGKRRTAANLASVLVPPDGITLLHHGIVEEGTIADLSADFPGFRGGLLTDPDPEASNPSLPDSLKFQTDPHAMTVPYDVEALWVPDDRDSVWSDNASDALQTFPRHGDQPGFNDQFHEKPGVNGFFNFNDFNADYWFITGVPVPAARVDKGGTGIGTINPSAPPPLGGIGGLNLPDGLIPAAANSGVSGSQVAIKAQVGQTILVRCLDAAYNTITVTFPVDVVIIAWDGRSLGVPPFGQYNKAYKVPAGTGIHMSVARRFDALIRETKPISSFATVEFLDTRGGDVVMTARIPVDIEDVERGAGGAISGRVTDKLGAPLAGVTMTLTGTANATTTTDALGNYSFTGLANGTYTVTPSLASFPPRRNVIINGADAIGRDFRGNTASGGGGGGGSAGGGGGGV